MASHAEGQLDMEFRASSRPQADLQAALEKCELTIGVDQYYRKFLVAGLTYISRLRTVHDLCKGDGMTA